MSNEKANVRSGASIFYTKNYTAIFAVPQGLKTSEMPSKIKIKIKQKTPWFRNLLLRLLHAIKAAAFFSSKTHMKSTVNFTKRNMKHHKTEEWAQSLLVYYDLSYIEVELDWSFNCINNSPQILAGWFIQMKVINIISITSADRIWMSIFY